MKAPQGVIRVLLAEDSAVTRAYLQHVIEQDAGLQVAGLAVDGLQAVRQAGQLGPDVILMDISMPRMDGYEATRQIMEATPVPIVLASASFDQHEVTMTFEALRAGALTVIEKPSGLDFGGREATTRKLIDTLKLAAGASVIRRRGRGNGVAPRTPSLVRPRQSQLQIIAIGASTGGPAALAEILGPLPPDLGVPIVVAQHIAPGFARGLADWLRTITRLDVRLACDGEELRAGTVFLPPGGHHIGVADRAHIQLIRDPEENALCPSVSVLLGTVAEAYGRSAMGILLTGMGRDGAAELLRLRNAGGLTIAQDSASSVVYGMPGEAFRLGAAEHVLAPGQIADLLLALGARPKTRSW